MITANRLQQATEELNGVNLGKFKIPKQIQLAEKDYYVIIGLSGKLDKSGLGATVTARKVYYDQRQYNRMKKDIESKKPIFKEIGANQFTKVVILHNPTVDLAKEKSEVETDGTIEGEVFETTGRLTDPKKLIIDNALLEAEVNNDNLLNKIAKEINAPFVKVKEYVQA